MHAPKYTHIHATHTYGPTPRISKHSHAYIQEPRSHTHTNANLHIYTHLNGHSQSLNTYIPKHMHTNIQITELLFDNAAQSGHTMSPYTFSFIYLQPYTLTHILPEPRLA